MKKWYAILCASFLVPIFALFFVSLADTDAVRSDNENRMLAKMPSFDMGMLIRGELSEQFENYYSDTFPFREKLLGTSKLINGFYSISLGNLAAIIPVSTNNDWDNGESIVDKVVDSEFTTGIRTTTATQTTETSVTTENTTAETTEEATAPVTSWTPIEYPGGSQPPDSNSDVAVDSGSILIVGNSAMEHYYGVDSSLENYAAAISRVKELLPDVNVFAMFCPTSIEFNAPVKYQSGTRSQLRAMNVAYSAMKGVVPVNTWSELYAHRDEYLYFRTDHHWTQRGAYYGYVAFCNAAGLQYHALEEYETYEVPGFLGTLYYYTKNYPQSSVLKNNPDYVEVFRPITSSVMTIYRDATLTDGTIYPIILSKTTAESLGSSSKYLMFTGGDNPICRIASDTVKNGRVLIITKESYANALIPFLSDHFQDIYVIDPREFNGEGKPSLNLIDFARQVGASDVLCVNYAFSASSPFMSIFNKMLP
jgi:hypothetical protein